MSKHCMFGEEEKEEETGNPIILYSYYYYEITFKKYLFNF